MNRSFNPPRFVVAFGGLVILAASVAIVVSPWPSGHQPTLDAKSHSTPPRGPSVCEVARQMTALGKTTEHNFYFAQCHAQGGD